MNAKPKKDTRADLQRKVVELTAQLASTYAYASAQLDKAGTKYMAASGVVVQLDALGGRPLMAPVVIRDGLSDETIAALRKDILRSYTTATELKPKA